MQSLASCRAGASPLLRLRPSARSPIRRRAVLAHASSKSKSQVENLRHITEDGWGLELLLLRAQDEEMGARKPPLLFVHGSYHGAWCWVEKFMPYFSERGFNTYAVSLRAQGNSDCISKDKDAPILVAGTLDSHSYDLADLVKNFPQPPVVVAHSFGALILQKYVNGIQKAQGAEGYPGLAGVGFVNAVPPSGNKDMIYRFLTRSPLLSLKLTWGFVAKSFATSKEACRELFFSEDIPPEDLDSFQKQLAACSPVRLIDLSDVTRQVPLPRPPQHAPPAFVLGGEDDKVVDVEAVKELAAAYGVEPVILPRLAHDCMLDTRWEQAAAEMDRWLTSITA